MRTVPFVDVWRDTVSLHGINPLKEFSPDLARQLIRYINSRVNFIWKVWPWPEWLLTEERAFRPVWNANDQYLRFSITDGQPDEIFYIPNTTYYKVLLDALGDPPVGTLPTDTTYFEELSPVDTFIAYDQRCKRSIGMALGVYRQNPRTSNNGCNNNLPLDFRPSEKGIDVPCGTGPTVFIHYKMPVPKFTIIPYVTGKSYGKGDVIFDPFSGECFQALAQTTALPADTFFWRRVPFLEVWSEFVSEGSFADSLMEPDQSTSSDTGYGAVAQVQAKQAIVQYHNANAEKAIQYETDALSSQGQKFYWYYSRPRYTNGLGWCCSQPWTGGTVSTLTDACEDDLGWVFPTPTAVPGVSLKYYNLVTALRATTSTPSLDQVDTRILFPTSLAQIVISQSGVRTQRLFELVNGPADPLDPDGQVQPLDYDAASNNKHWSSLQ